MRRDYGNIDRLGDLSQPIQIIVVFCGGHDVAGPVVGRYRSDETGVRQVGVGKDIGGVEDGNDLGINTVSADKLKKTRCRQVLRLIKSN
jgi:hypothetical protein